MGRSREFDRDEVLERASRLFWRMGYDAVTIEDLEAATGLGRGSLYNAFGDKEGVFLAALDSYLARHGAAPFTHLDEPNVSVGIRRTLGAIVARMRDPANPPGCLLTNTSLAAVGSSPRIKARVAASLADMEASLERAIERARRERQIPASAEPRALARFYAAVAQSLSVDHKVFGDAAALERIVDTAMSAWPGRPRRRRAPPRGAAARSGR